MSLGKKRGGARAVPYINVTPLIDVLLVMLIIFMVITPLKPSHFQADIPSPPDKTPQMNTQANPLTLVVSISGDSKITLNKGKDHPGEKPTGDEPCVSLGLPDYGTVDNPGNLGKCISFMLEQRKQRHIYKDPLPPNLTEDQKIERTVFIKAPRTLRYGNVVKVIDAIKGAGANPVGLQLDGLEDN